MPNLHHDADKENSLILSQQKIDNNEVVISHDLKKMKKVLSIRTDNNVVSTYDPEFSPETEIKNFVKVKDCDMNSDLYRFITFDPKWLVFNYWIPNSNQHYFYAKNESGKLVNSKNLNNPDSTGNCIAKNFDSVKSIPISKLVLDEN